MRENNAENLADMTNCIFGITRNCKIGKNTKIYNYVNLYECEIGDNCMIGSFVEMQKGVKVGNNVRIQSHSFLCEGVVVGSDVFIGHGVIFSNDKYPSIKSQRDGTWKMEITIVERGASIGNNSTILPCITIGEGAMIGAGSVVTKNVPKGATVVGNPGAIRYRSEGAGRMM